MTDPLLAVTIAIGAIAVALIVFDQRAAADRSPPTRGPGRAASNPSWARARAVHGVRSGGDAAMTKRERIEPNTSDKRYVRRDEAGQFKEMEDVGRSSAQDQKREAKNLAKRGQGDRGDRES